MIEDIIKKIDKLQLQIEKRKIEIMKKHKRNSASSLHLLLQE